MTPQQAQDVADLLRALAEALDAGVPGEVTIETDPQPSMDRQNVHIWIQFDDAELLAATSPNGKRGRLWPPDGPVF